MRLQRKTLFWSGLVSFIALAISYVAYLKEYEYISDICVGLFSSGILICITSVVSYFYERNAAVLSLYRGCFKFMESLTNSLRLDKMINLYELREDLDEIIHVYNENVYYYVCELKHINQHSNIRRIIDDIWENIRHIYLFVSDDREILLKCLLGDLDATTLKKYPWKHVGDESVAYLEKLQKALDKLAYQMNYFNKRKGKNMEVPIDAD